MFDLLINEKSMANLGFFVVKRPDKPTPQKRYMTAQILDRDGTLYRDTGHYENYELTIEINFNVKDPKQWANKARELRSIIAGAKTLRYSDDPEFYGKIIKADTGTVSRTNWTLGKADVTFAMDPYDYQTEGSRFAIAAGFLFNPFPYTAHPVYRISGGGYCTLKINGKESLLHVNGGMVLDTDLMTCSSPADVSLRYEDLWLVPGENSIVVSDDFRVEIQPNWRCI